MSVILQPLLTPALRPAQTPDEYAIHKAALEWGLADPIIINSAEDVKAANWRDRVNPFEHQVRNLITFCRRLPVTLLADDVGLGKTISAGLIMSELIARRRVARALIVCPKILMDQWKDELDEKFGLASTAASGKGVVGQLRQGDSALITTYETFRDHFSAITAQKEFQMLIFDEAHKLRNLHSSDPPALAKRAYHALSVRAFRFILMLTATPVQNSLWDIYSLVDLLVAAKGHTNPFGPPLAFRTRFLADGKIGRSLKPERADEFRDILAGYLVRTRRADVRLPFPERKVLRSSVSPTHCEQEMWKLIAEPIQHLNRLSQISLGQALMSSPEALVAQVSHMVLNGHILRSVLNDLQKVVGKSPQTAKLHALDTLIERLRTERPRDWRLVIFTHRIETQKAIGLHLAGMGIPYGFIRGGHYSENQKSIADLWVGADDRSPPAINVLISTDSGSQGLNLQVANVLMNYDLPWNPMIVEQRIGRVQRMASDYKTVSIFNVVLRNTVEELVVFRLMEKLQLAAQTVGHIEAVLEGSGMEGAEDDSDSFENRIRELVVRSLAGHNIEQKTRMVEESIEDGRALMEKHEGFLNDTLGCADAGAGRGPSVPRLGRNEPSMPIDKFVFAALRARGGKITPCDSGVHVVEFPGSPTERITFDEQKAKPATLPVDLPPPLIGRTPTLYQTDSRAFVALVQSWSENAGHFVCRVDVETENAVAETVRQWCNGIERTRYIDHQIGTRRSVFSGKALLHAKVDTAHDRYEKLIEAEVGPYERNLAISEDALRASKMDGDINPTELAVDLTPTVRAALEDKDVSAFCRFYIERRTLEVQAAGVDAQKQQRLSDEFTSKLFPVLVGMKGLLYEVLRIHVRYQVDGCGPYENELSILPAAERVVQEPARSRCDQSLILVPMDCLSACAISGKTVLRHLLCRSATGRFGLKEFCIGCIDGRQLLCDEVAVSSVSGAYVGLDVIRKSAMSGLMADPSECGRCEFTGAEVLKSELVRSEASGRWFRNDQQYRSSVSNTVGHISEFLNCSVTGLPLLEREASFSAISKKPAQASLMKVCAETGRRLLPSEVGFSAVSGICVGLDLLRKSEISDLMAAPSELARCEFTGVEVLKRELVISEVSGKSLRSDQQCRSSVSNMLGHISEFLRCSVTGLPLLPGEAAFSEVSRKPALPDKMKVCAVTARRLLPDEVCISDVTGACVALDTIKRSALSGMLAEPSQFGICEFTGSSVLKAELERSQISGRLLRRDQQCQSAVSGRAGHSSEFIRCSIKGFPVLKEEAEFCAITGKAAMPGLLPVCSATGKRVLPGLVGRSQASGSVFLKKLLVPSSISGQLMHPDEAIVSLGGERCLPSEAGVCTWTRKRFYPDDMGRCALTNLIFVGSLLTKSSRFPRQFAVLRALLDDEQNQVDAQDCWGSVVDAALPVIGKCEAIGAIASPAGDTVAVCVVLSSWLGLKVRYAGLLFDLKEGQIRGSIGIGRRESSCWLLERVISSS